MNISKLVLFCSFVFLLAPLPGQAKAKVKTTDVLVLKNGDRITGEIDRIWDAEITIETEYSDKFDVDVPDVAYIESKREFEIDLADGRKLVVTFPGADAEGNQIIKTGSGTESVSLGQLHELDEPEDYYDWESHVDMSGDIKMGNTESRNTKLRADTTFKFGDHRHIGDITFFNEELAGVTTKDQNIFNYNYNWLFSEPWFFSALGTFERDPIIQLDSRFTASAGIGRDIWNTPRRTLNFQLGAGFRAEEIGDASESSAVATWVLRFRHDFIGDDLEIFHDHFIVSNLSGRTNTSFRTSTGVRYEITDLLYANFSIDFDYETHPADDTIQNEDIVMLFGLGLEFE
jgi:putative salt-induced outer membrane protein YdiY